MATPVRERTIRWEDTARTARAFAELPGIEVARGIADGTLAMPPMAVLLELRAVEIGEGIVRFAMVPRDYMSNPLGFLHGGALATLLDTVLTVCVFTKLPRGRSCTTTDLQMQFVRPIVPGGPEIVAQGRVVHLGGSRATAQAQAVDAAGKIYGTATAGMAVLDIAALTPR